MKAGILAVGTELLMGQTVNTNAAELSRELSELGIGTYLQYTVGDNRERMASHLRQLMESCDLVITTGGLGPTQDDITKEVLAEVLGVEMFFHEPSWQAIQERFKRFNRTMPESNQRQAYFPEGSSVLSNEKGTAPACLVDRENVLIAVLPGPPSEMRYVFHKHLKPYLQERVSPNMFSAYLSVYDMGESMVEETLLDLINAQTDPTIATYAGDGKVLLRITASQGSLDENKERVGHMVQTIKRRIGKYIVSTEGADLSKALLDALVAKKATVAFAESCTGGKIASSIIANSGASDVVHSGIVCYSNDAKKRFLNVPENLLNQYGAVSPEVCKAMIEGLLTVSCATYGIAVTGIAGPGGGSEEKPVGLVYIGIGTPNGTRVYKQNFYGDRNLIQVRATYKAMKLLYDELQNMEN